MDEREALEHVNALMLKAAMMASLEAVIVNPACFGLSTATPVQRAIARVLDDQPLEELAHNDDVREAIGRVEDLPDAAREVAIVSGTRVGKSMIAAACGIRATQRVDLSGLSKGEPPPRFNIVSLTKDLAEVVYGHIRGNIENSPILSSLLLDEPTRNRVLLLNVKHQRPCEIKVVAADAKGSSLVARWCLGNVWDEFLRMNGAGDSIVNLDHQRAAVQSRLLPGAKNVYISAPFGRVGPGYEKIVRPHAHKPSRKMVVIWARADKLNPVWWTPERAAELRATDPDAYLTDYEAQFLEPEELFFSTSLVELAARDSVDAVPARKGATYVAAIDPATRSNTWTLVVGTRDGEKRRNVLAQQWVPKRGQPLKPRVVLSDIASLLRPYRVTDVSTDQWSVDALADIAEDYDLTLVQEKQRGKTTYDQYRTLREWLHEGLLELCPQVVDDLKPVRRRVTQSTIQIVLPEVNGRHCDYAPALARMAVALLDDFEEPPPPKGSVAYQEQKLREIEEREAKKIAERASAYSENWFDA